ncbi:hypothetical protein LEN26_004699 [Aphanomyces euteiches]|nr:hypothetical protein LEN26_004699 [Aphanomyces euteiches]
MRLLVALALTLGAAVAFNQRSQDSPVMTAYGQVAIDSTSEEESEASPARQLKAISRKPSGRYGQMGRKIGGGVGLVGGATAGAPASVGAATGVE